MSYEAWRITFQDSEQAARAAYAGLEEMSATLLRTQAQLSAFAEAVNEEVVDLVRCGIGANYGGEFYDQKLGQVHEPLLALMDAQPDECLAQALAGAVMGFVDVPVGAFESGHLDTPWLTIADVYQEARHFVRDRYGVEVQPLAEAMGEAFARKCQEDAK